ncbi:hypothetical protein [Clostridium estertheticum]|nr:hypothetical protein [Clostridium estertheticum]MCB2353722.1 hypothetical protein [Clostridium estertheticum]WBL48282.1 hypothetical protein LOR37_06380 [Clostridium estertheticum]
MESKNNTALNLYKVCGFEEMSVMNYYRFKGGMSWESGRKNECAKYASV